MWHDTNGIYRHEYSIHRVHSYGRKKSNIGIKCAWGRMSWTSVSSPLQKIQEKKKWMKKREMDWDHNIKKKYIHILIRVWGNRKFCCNNNKIWRERDRTRDTTLYVNWEWAMADWNMIGKVKPTAAVHMLEERWYKICVGDVRKHRKKWVKMIWQLSAQARTLDKRQLHVRCVRACVWEVVSVGLGNCSSYHHQQTK